MYIKCCADLIAFTYALWMLLSTFTFFAQIRFCKKTRDKSTYKLTMIFPFSIQFHFEANIQKFINVKLVETNL